MKKIFIYILLIFSIFMFTGCGNKGYKEINYDKLKEMVSNQETFTLFIGRETCSSCDMFKSILKDRYTKEYDATIYYIDTDKLTDDEMIEFNSTYTYDGTPAITIIVEGKFSTYNTKTGYNSYDDMIEMMKKYNIINE